MHGFWRAMTKPMGEDTAWKVIGRWLAWWFPDLTRIESASARRTLWRSAFRPVSDSWAYRASIILPYTGCLFALLVGPRIVDIWIVVVVAAFLMTLSYPAALWPVRRRITHNLRRILNERGLPTCLKCGYDLTGIESGVCPECGTKIDS